MVRLPCFVASLLLLAAPSFAAPFTGRYNVESLADADGNSVSGFIDFVNAPMGTSSFNLDAAFGVTGFEFVASGPGLDTLTADFVTRNEILDFDFALGAAVLTPLENPTVRVWNATGDLDGGGFVNDIIQLSNFGNGASDWGVIQDNSNFFQVNSTNPPAWKLVLDPTVGAPIPEPGTLALAGLGLAALLYRRRRA